MSATTRSSSSGLPASAGRGCSAARSARIAGLAALAFAASAIPSWGGGVAEPSGYRMDDYRGQVPDSLSGATVVTTQEAEKLWRDGTAVLFDVMPQAPKPQGLPPGTIWRDPGREDIPGSIWLPNVGYGAINPETAAYFRTALELHTRRDKSHPVLFYCMINCWMSWNAAKRAVEWGYTSVMWYPDGVDGWELEGLPLAENRPFPDAQ